MQANLILAAVSHDEAAAIYSVYAVMGVVMLIVFAVTTAITVAVCLFIVSALSRIPREHRRMEPEMVWLLLVPCFGLVWNFFVFQRVPESFRSYFASLGRTDMGDCGRGLGLAYAICSALCVLPLVNYLAAPASLVLLIICLIRFHDLKSRILANVPPGIAGY